MRRKVWLRKNFRLRRDIVIVSIGSAARCWRGSRFYTTDESSGGAGSHIPCCESRADEMIPESAADCCWTKIFEGSARELRLCLAIGISDLLL